MPKTLIAAASADAADAGQAIAENGGNAVDAAIAAVIASMTTELGIVSPGAGGFVTIWPPNDAPIVIDAYAEMPGRGRDPSVAPQTETVAMEYGGGMETVVGWGTVAIPGAFAGFDVASKRYGNVPWAELFHPAVQLAEHGFLLSQASGYYLQYAHDVIYGWDEEASAIFHKDDGQVIETGDLVKIPALGACLDLIAHAGVNTLYRGDLAVELIRACAERGGLITEHDLEEYQPVVRPPARVGLHGWDIATNAPPAVGGTAVAALLTLIERLEINGWSADDVAEYAAAQDAVFSFRRSDLDGDVDRFAGADLLHELALEGDLKAMHRSPSTVHTSAVDETGLACSVTVSAGYGSGTVIPGWGFGLNNSLGELELTSEGLHALPAGQRLLSNMAPTIGRGSAGEVMAIGSPGADRITSAISTVLLNHVVCGMSLDEAVAAPRLHAELFEGAPALAVEPGIDTTMVSDLVVRVLPENSMYFGGVQAAAMDERGSLIGAADPRRTGAVRIGGSS
ncbi:MAG: gamma-glutamyltransferase [Acidimicrobiia bacterium]